MEYLQALTHGNLNDTSLCFISSPPEGMGKGDWRMTLGERARRLVPVPTRIRLQDMHPGTKLPGFIGNTPGYLIFNAKGRAIIEAHSPGQKIEFLPFELINHKGRLHSADYCIVNPIGGFDALNVHASTLRRSAKDGSITGVTNIVLDSQKLQTAPALFRLAQKTIVYILNRELFEALKAAGVNNLACRVLPQQAPA